MGVKGTTVVSRESADGRLRVTGGPLLGETQAYPSAYGLAAHGYWTEWLACDEPEVSDVESSVSDTSYQEIDGVLEYGDIAEAREAFGLSSTNWGGARLIRWIHCRSRGC